MVVMFIISVGAVVLGADAVAVSRTEASNLPLVIDVSLEDEDPLFRLALVGGKGASSCTSSSAVCGRGGRCDAHGSREVFQCGLDLHILFGGGSGKMVQSSVAGGRCRSNFVKLVVQ